MDYIKIYNNLFSYAKNNKTDLFKEEMEAIKKDYKFNINIIDKTNKYFINYAIITNNIELTKYLLENGAKLDMDNDNNTIITIPIEYNMNELLEILLEADKNNIGTSIINFKNRAKKTPLHIAIEFKNMNAIQLLLKYKANANVSDKDGYNALYYAVKSKSIEICTLILQYVTNIDSRCVSGESVLHIACALQFTSCVKLLVQNKIDVNIHDTENEITAIYHCVSLNNYELTEYLINNNAKLDIQDTRGNTILHYAISY